MWFFDFCWMSTAWLIFQPEIFSFKYMFQTNNIIISYLLLRCCCTWGKRSIFMTTCLHLSQLTSSRSVFIFGFAPDFSLVCMCSRWTVNSSCFFFVARRENRLEIWIYLKKLIKRSRSQILPVVSLSTATAREVREKRPRSVHSRYVDTSHSSFEQSNRRA